MSNKNLFTSTKSDAKIDQLSRVFSRASDHVDQTRVDVSVVLPVFNEEKAISSCVKEIIDTLLPEGLNFEIVAINDGSTDLSEQILLGLCREYPKILRIASHIQNKGNGAALRTGIRLSRGEVVVLMDSDGQHSANEIPRLLALIPPYDMVVGTRTAKYQGAWYRNLANRIYNHFASWLTKFPIPDLTSGFRAMRRHAVMHFLPIYPSGFSSSATATMAFLKAGYSVLFVPIEVHPRVHGKSKINLFRDGSRFLMIMLRIVMLYDPLRIFLPITFFLILLGLLSMVVGMLAAQRPVVPGSSVVLFIAAIISFLLGLVATQISNVSIPYHGDEYVQIYEEPTNPPEDQ